MSAILAMLLALALPSTMLAFCCLAGGALFSIGRRARQVGAFLLGVGVLGFGTVAVLPVDQWLLRPLEERFPRPGLPAHVDGVVVLGGAVAARVAPDRGLPILNADADRLVAFAMLARTYPGARLVFAGGPAAAIPDGMSEAAASRMVLEQLGVAPGRVVFDDQSRTTWENAVNALALAHPQPGETWLLVTSASHMPRAVGAFRAAGWPAVLPWPVAYRTTRHGWPPPLQPVGARLAAMDLGAHELAGLLGYRLRGRTIELLPGL